VAVQSPGVQDRLARAGNPLILNSTSANSTPFQKRSVGDRGAACKFTVNVRQRSGRKLHVSNFTFTRFTTLPHFPDLYVDLYVTAGGMKKVWIAGRGKALE
jgi:hypothetical protein